MSVSMALPTNEVKFLTPSFTLHKFSTIVSEKEIVYLVIKMTDSCMVFINDKDNMELVNLYLGMVNRFRGAGLATRLTGSVVEEESNKAIALRLSKKLGKVVYVSCNIHDQTLLEAVERRIYDEVEQNPRYF